MGPVLRPVALAAVLLGSAAVGQPPVGVGPPKGSEPGRLSAPVVYKDLMLVFASGDGVAAVVFTDKLEKGVAYKFRYESKDGKNEAGAGKLFETFGDPPPPGKEPVRRPVLDGGGERWFKAGPFKVEWSRGSEGQGWIYYAPEQVRVHIAHAKDFDKLDLKRFAK